MSVTFLLKLAELVVGRESGKAIVTIKRGAGTGPKVFPPGVVNVSEYLVIYSKNRSDWMINRVYREIPRDDRYSRFIRNRDKDPSEWEFTSLMQAFADFKDTPKADLKEALGEDYESELDEFVFSHADAVAQTAGLSNDQISKEAVKMKQESRQHPDRIYHLKREDYDDWYIMGGRRILFYSDRLVEIGSRIVQGELLTDIWDDVLPNDLHNEGGVRLKKGKKPEKLIGRLIELATRPADLVLDFFVGSGTTCAAAQKMHREWIGIDSTDRFESLLKRRLINTLSGDSSGISSSTGWEGGGLFAYQQLESYEDALNNTKVERPDEAQQDLLQRFKDYMLHYTLDFETRDSPTLLAQEAFEKPFDYTLKIQHGHESPEDTTVDLVETFHYLIGMHVKRLEHHQHQDRTYVVSRGDVRTEHGIEKVATVWRDTEGLDWEEEAKWITEDVLTDPLDRVYVNGPSFIHKAEPLEIIFRSRMEEA